ncbi:hypothetical protein PIROE2DRAFT_17684 [Piromyces sp. E2]|nr:hypothetical protein PIROE2DRAFT_17684 [Piromyces sp. E2]|eukprot:OUM57362.1 hypothetical protein PIROE2DRAFT_17684 [Piromyces sp. E2]
MILLQIIYTTALTDTENSEKDELLYARNNENFSNYFNQEQQNPHPTHSGDNINLCFPEKYRKYERIISKAYNTIKNISVNKLTFGYYQNIEDYVKSFTLYHCDVAMIEPLLYDQYYHTLSTIQDEIIDTINERMEEKIDGRTYTELIKELQANKNRTHINALYIQIYTYFIVICYD